jgi:hypothetical protein
LHSASWLHKKFNLALTQRSTEIQVVNSLSQLRNPHGEGAKNYTVGFFCSQWDDQVRVALEKKEEEEQKEKLATFLLNEEVLESTR